MRQITMRSIPADEADTFEAVENFYLDCSECGPLGLVSSAWLKATVADHMETHGVNGDSLR